ncbi:FtsX-like permease family protein [Streptomyces avermitilis]|uniref:FtsX-like permease family protein n=1 Tax=Streptomyces avermitilis TaxID=33903 RepID=UPI00381F581A
MASHANDVQERVKTALHNPLVKTAGPPGIAAGGHRKGCPPAEHGLRATRHGADHLGAQRGQHHGLVRLRTAQEIGMLRAIGMRREGIKRMIRLESIVVSLFGSVLGIVVGTFTAWAMGTVFSHSKLLSGYTMQIPWERILLFLAAAAAVGVLAALWPAHRAAALNTLQAIRAQ